MDLKEFLLEGGTIVFPYKDKDDDWVGEAKINIFSGDHSLPKVFVDTTLELKVFTLGKLDEAIDFYTNHVFNAKNLWYKMKPALREFNLRENWVDLELKEDYERVWRRRNEML